MQFSGTLFLTFKSDSFYSHANSFKSATKLIGGCILTANDYLIGISIVLSA